MLPPEEQRLAIVRALKSLALADGELHPQEQRLIEITIEALELDTDVESLSTIEPEELAAAALREHDRETLLKRMVLLSTLDSEVSEEEVALLERYGQALEVEERAVHNLRQLVEGHWRRMAFDLGRRSAAPGKVKSIWHEEGLRGLWQLAKSALGVPDAEQEARFAALGELPEGSFGHALYHQFADNGFAYPGQKHGPPASLLFHDVGHVLSGYGTEPSGELKVAGFQAGYMEEDPLVMYLLVAMLFQLGIEPIAKARGVDAAKGMLDIDTFQQAFARGQALKVNLLDWDPWPHVERPLSELRQELGLS